jgi:UDP:flavonoid glycosyltransferase YjiC (YdhE family)
VNPFIGIGAALKRRGHHVTVITNGYFEDLVRKEGLDFVELGTRDEFLRLVNHPDLWHPIRSFLLIYRDGVLPSLRPMFKAVESLAVPGQTVVIGSVLAMGARIAQEKLGISFVSAHLQPAVFRSYVNPPLLPGHGFIRRLPPRAVRAIYRLADWQVDRILAPEINRFRAELGLPPVHGIVDQWWHSPQRIIGLFPEWFAPPAPDWPPQVRLTGFPLYDGALLDPIPPELEEFLAAGPPPVIFTPGSAMSQGASFFQESVKVCERLGCRGLLLTKFPASVPARLPAHVRCFGYVPFSSVLPRAAAFVHHGGIGTTAQALAAGIPQLVMPLAHDQPDNAARVESLGVAQVIRPGNYRAENVAPKLRKLLDNPVYREKSQALQRRITGIDKVEETCRLIESI